MKDTHLRILLKFRIEFEFQLSPSQRKTPDPNELEGDPFRDIKPLGESQDHLSDAGFNLILVKPSESCDACLCAWVVISAMQRQSDGARSRARTRPRLVTGTVPSTNRVRAWTSLRAANVGDSTKTGVCFTFVPYSRSPRPAQVSTQCCTVPKRDRPTCVPISVLVSVRVNVPRLGTRVPFLATRFCAMSCDIRHQTSETSIPQTAV